MLGKEVDMCPNCGYAVISYNPDCRGHSTARSLMKSVLQPELKKGSQKAKPLPMPLYKISEATAVVLAMSHEDLLKQNGVETWAVARARQMFMYVALVEFRHKRAVIAKYLNCKSYKVGHKVSLMRTEMQSRSQTRRCVGEILLMCA